MLTLQRYESRTAAWLIAASLLYLACYATQVLWLAAPEPAQLALLIAENALWAAFIMDFALRISLADARLRYVVSHTVDVITIVLPMFRPLRVLRVFAPARILIERGQHIRFTRAAAGITVAAVFIAVIAALVELDLERNAPDSNITSFGQSLWWAAVTMSTVGYGDVYPVTPAGRLAAVGMLVVGISLLGAVTATFATWVADRISTREERTDERILAEIQALRTEVGELRAHLDAGDLPS